MYEPRPTDITELVLKAAKTDRKVVLPEPNQLFIDIDSDEDLEFYECQMLILDRFVESTETITASASPGHYHVVVTLSRDPSPWERVAMQAALGSDRKRELLAIINRTGDLPGPNCFFEAISG